MPLPALVSEEPPPVTTLLIVTVEPLSAVMKACEPKFNRPTDSVLVPPPANTTWPELTVNESFVPPTAMPVPKMSSALMVAPLDVYEPGEERMTLLVGPATDRLVT